MSADFELKYQSALRLGEQIIKAQNEALKRSSPDIDKLKKLQAAFMKMIDSERERKGQQNLF